MRTAAFLSRNELMIFTWGTRERPLRRWPHAPCQCGESGWVLFLSYPFFTLFWIFGACTSRAYVLVCSSCGRRVVPTETNAVIEAEVGNAVPMKYRFGMAMLVTAILVGAAFGSLTTNGSRSDPGTSSSSGSSALSLLGFLALVAMVGFLIFFGNRSAVEAKNTGGVPLLPPTLRKPTMSAGIVSAFAKNAPSSLSSFFSKASQRFPAFPNRFSSSATCAIATS